MSSVSKFQASSLKPGPVVLDLEGKTLSEKEKELLKNPFVGGVILFARNYESVEQLATLIGDIRTHREKVIICVDQEGGRVQRFKAGFTRLPPMQVFGCFYEKDKSSALRSAEYCGWLMAAELMSLGVDLSFAPVLDADKDFSQVIGDRSFHRDPKIVALLAGAFIRGMSRAGMVATAKHFPGHGSVQADSHLDLPIDERSLEQIKQHDLLPFVELRDSYQAVMPAHILFPAVDSKPVGYSSLWLDHILRTRMGFKGVIFSDDLSMEGAAFAGSYSARALSALSAGCDAVLVCNNREGALEVLEELASRRWQRDGKLESLSAKKNQYGGLSELQQSAEWQAAAQDLKNQLKTI